MSWRPVKTKMGIRIICGRAWTEVEPAWENIVAQEQGTFFQTFTPWLKDGDLFASGFSCVWNSVIDNDMEQTQQLYFLGGLVMA